MTADGCHPDFHAVGVHAPTDVQERPLSRARALVTEAFEKQLIDGAAWRWLSDRLAPPAPTADQLREHVAAALWVSLLGKHRNGRTWTRDCPTQHRDWWLAQADAAIAAMQEAPTAT